MTSVAYNKRRGRGLGHKAVGGLIDGLKDKIPSVFPLHPSSPNPSTHRYLGGIGEI